MSYSIKIVNNNTNEVIIDEGNALAIIGGIGVEGGEHVVGFTDCNAIKMADTIHAAKKAIDILLKDSPEVDMLMRLVELEAKLKDELKNIEK